MLALPPVLMADILKIAVHHENAKPDCCAWGTLHACTAHTPHIMCWTQLPQVHSLKQTCGSRNTTVLH